MVAQKSSVFLSLCPELDTGKYCLASKYTATNYYFKNYLKYFLFLRQTQNVSWMLWTTVVVLLCIMLV